MAKKRSSAEQIVSKLREAKVHLSKGLPAAEVCKKLGITENTYYRWRREYGGLRVDQAKRLLSPARRRVVVEPILVRQLLQHAGI